ncbi:alcohol dehydrogenase catalytic domain-containing protein [Auraticoccus sp. F435]|uniref:Alcohol dehydrogenase catalytic domain-containing protein n=1 Tax=Auraticoccus cholistanensis TaxID=2656650 RepID=A0A6A9UZV8_9ACTN|nr:NAD(P)-dependent alcohol dehydrogenase [Auraticoccus cholistanensis]MVA74509.1 alcohol dehydrogenase catalytic domain-containing protein [Auraticoccus cholistanensis]
MTTTVPSTMRASVLLEAKRLELQERPVPEPGPGEVLIRVRSVGVCGSDVHYYEHGRIGDFVVEQPLVLGHEMSGVVAAVGPGVDEARVGERVAVDPQRPCRTCRLCKTGHLNLCERMQFFATPPVDGAFADYVVAPADFTFAVPDTLSDHAAALLEPFSVGMWACGKAALEPGSRVLISGGGPIGALTALAARSYGATEVVVTDLVESRRRRILDFGATASLDPTAADVDLGELGVDAFIECSGATPALLSGLDALRPGGRAVMVGLGAETMPIPVQTIMNKELTLTGIFRYVDTWPKVIAAAQQPGVDLDALVTAEFDLEDAEFALTADADPTSMKSVVVVSR